MARLLGRTRARVRVRELPPLVGLGAVGRLRCRNLARLRQPLAAHLRLGRPFLVRLRWTFAGLARLGGSSRLDPVRLPVRRLLGDRVDGSRTRSGLGDQFLHTLDRGLVPARRVVATVRGICGRGLRRLPAVRAVRPSRGRLLAARPVVAAAAAATAPATPAALALLTGLLLIVGSRLAALAVWLRVALRLARRMLLAVVASSFLRRAIAAITRLPHWPLAAAVARVAHWPLAAAVALCALAAVATTPAALAPLLAMRARFPVAVAVATAWVVAMHAAARALLVARGGGRLLRCRRRRRG